MRIGGPKYRIWLKRSLPYPPLWIGSGIEALKLAEGLRFDLESFNLGEINNKGIGGQNLQCVELSHKKSSFKKTVCFDSARGVLVRAFHKGGWSEFSDYRNFAGKNVPFTIRVYEGKKPSMEVEVTELDLDPNPDPALFTPPSGAEERAGCENPEPADALVQPEPPYPDEARRERVNGQVDVWISVDEAGKVVNTTVARSDNSLFDPITRSTIQRLWRFKPASCGGVPVPSEAMVTMSFRLYF